ncbi:TonB-dependent receptor domain-containing protein, partial [Escherichia coli]|uniref:TonB-dependent receptor domain-containing protein n=2 Tax=Pseudomonadota TaxID=1224 RepID=UPI0028E07BE6
FELQSTLVAAPGLTLGGTLAFTDAKLTDNAPSIGGRSGDRLPLTPEWSGSLTADYRHAIRGDWTGAIGADYRYAGARTSL